MPGSIGRGPPADLLLKEDLPCDDPLQLIGSAGAGLSMATPLATEHRPFGSGYSMDPPSAEPRSLSSGYGMCPPSSAGSAWPESTSRSMDSSMTSQMISRKMYGTPPAAFFRNQMRNSHRWLERQATSPCSAGDMRASSLRCAS